MSAFKIKENITRRNWKERRAERISFFAFPLAILWMEIIVKLWDFRTIWNRGLLYTTLFSLSIGLFFAAVCRLGKKKTNRKVSLILIAAATFPFMVQAVHFTVMRTVFAIYSVSVAAGATEYWRIGLYGVWRTLPALVPLAAPLVLFIIFGKRFIPESRGSIRVFSGTILLAIAIHALTVGIIYSSQNGIHSPWNIYTQKNNPELSISNFGVLTSLRLDVKKMLFPSREEPSEPKQNTGDGDKNLVAESQENVMNIDFQALAKEEENETLDSLHHYFAEKKPSKKNKQTAMFKGKNLIVITAESFNSWAVREDLTPTLYALSKQGIVCKNFYTPLWWISTSDGEYVSCTSLIPKSGDQSLGNSATNNLYFTLGNQMKRQGYDTRAYHNHTYNYYGRDKTHPNMGYQYKGVGNGLHLTPTWPESDAEMIKETISDYVGTPPFHTYYMTVSGHLQYSFEKNDMAAKHRSKVEHLSLSEESKAYLACQIELDLALETLLENLRASGELENTVICLYGDHYPYGLTEKAITELSGSDTILESLELYRSTMILWSSSIEEPIEVTKPCSNLDILPTLSNLFGLEYDSRLLMGRDIFADGEGLVIFSDSSYITELGEYYGTEDSFYPAENREVPEGYPEEILQIVQDKFLYSNKILTTDYYEALGLS